MDRRRPDGGGATAIFFIFTARKTGKGGNRPAALSFRGIAMPQTSEVCGWPCLRGSIEPEGFYHLLRFFPRNLGGLRLISLGGLNGYKRARFDFARHKRSLDQADLHG